MWERRAGELAILVFPCLWTTRKAGSSWNELLWVCSLALWTQILALIPWAGGAPASVPSCAVETVIALTLKNCMG